VSVAHALGGNHHDEASKIVHTSLPTAIICGIILSVIGVLLAEPLLTLMSTPANVLPLSTLYMQVYFSGMTFSMVYNFCGAILRAAGDTKSPLIFLAISGVVNVILNLIFVTVFGMGVEGVALATIISQAISAVLVVIALMRRQDGCRLYIKKIRMNMASLLKIVRIGLPAGLQGCMFSISNVIIQSSINSFDSEIIMSGNGAASNLEGFVYVIMNAFHQTSVNFIGQNTGARQYKRVMHVFLICLACVFVAGLATGVPLYLFGQPLLSLYINDSVDAISIGMIRFSIVASTYFLCGLMDVSTGALRGMGVSFIPMLITILGVCGIRIGWVFTIFQIPQFHTLESLYVSYPISWVIAFVALMFSFFVVYRKRLRQLH